MKKIGVNWRILLQGTLYLVPVGGCSGSIFEMCGLGWVKDLRYCTGHFNKTCKGLPSHTSVPEFCGGGGSRDWGLSTEYLVPCTGPELTHYLFAAHNSVFRHCSVIIDWSLVTCPGNMTQKPYG